MWVAFLLPSGPASAVVSVSIGPNVNITTAAGSQAEGTIAINPTNTQELFFASNPGATARRSTDGGATWGAAGAGIGASCCDNVAAWDSFGNLFLVNLNSGATAVPLYLSTDGGANFSLLATIDTGSVDQPSVKAGAGAVWVTWNDTGTIMARGAAVTGLGTVGAFTAEQAAPGSAGVAGQFGDIAIGPTGEVVVTYQSNTQIFVNTDADGLGAGGFAAQVFVSATNVAKFDFITAQDARSIDAEANLAWDRSGGTNDGRLYLAYTDETPDESDDTDIFVRFSDDNGANWSAAVRVNDDVTTRSQFNPNISIDQTAGNVAVTWHDARNDAGNNNTQFFGTVSDTGGASFQANFQISTGTSNEDTAASSTDYGDYTWSDFHDGGLYPVWADNSNSTGDNPAGANSTFDMYTAAITAVVNQPPTADAGPDQTVECTGPGGASVTLDGSGSSDPDGDPLTFTWTGPFGTASGPTPTVTLPLGTHIITLTVDDGNGGTSSDTVTVNVVDTTPPNITTVTASPNSLWPPNHKLVQVTVTASASDTCSGTTACTITSVSSNEPVNGLGDGDTAPDWVITGNLTVKLRAERSGTGTGRVYTITVQCTDASGNSSTKDVTVTVPHNRG